ncbi:MAG: hypothetical protein QHJ82_06760 [Verrucomicrobiota bacterium]|nr:hypothetical protein [Verrucomicrobiota bacterium]
MPKRLLILIALVGATNFPGHWSGVEAKDGEMADTSNGAGQETATWKQAVDSWAPSWLAKAPSLPPPKGQVIRVANADDLLTAVNRIQPKA